MELLKTDLMRNGFNKDSWSQLWPLSKEKRQEMIAEAAYYRAEQRGFHGGDPVIDWLAAESEIAEGLAKWKVIWGSPKIMVLQLC